MDKKELGNRNMENKIKVAILSSRKLNENDIFNKHKETIKSVMSSYSINEVDITIGNIKNKLLIDFIQELGFNVIVKRQSVPSLENSNKKIIREHEMVIFFNYEESPHISNFIDYAIEVSIPTILPINLSK